jgi:outer membrane protein OmpA-like peptidoglycan-associated protein
MLVSTKSQSTDIINKIFIMDQLGNATTKYNYENLFSAQQDPSVAPNSIKLKDSDVSFNYGIGYQLNPNLSISLQHFDLGERWISFDWNQYTATPELTNRSINKLTPASASGFQFDISYAKKITDNISLVGKLGAVRWSDSFHDVTYQSTSVYRERGEGLLAGIGLEYSIDDNFQVNVGVDQYELNSHEIRNFYLGVKVFPFMKSGGEAVTLKKSKEVIVVEGRGKPSVDNINPQGIPFKKTSPEFIAKSNSSDSVEVLNPTIIYFSFDSSALDENSVVSLQDYSDYMHQNDNCSLQIFGHTDSKGPSNYNYSLSKKRADVVLGYFLSTGISHNQLKTIPKGEESPLINAGDEVILSQNRRVELFKVCQIK